LGLNNKPGQPHPVQFDINEMTTSSAIKAELRLLSWPWIAQALMMSLLGLTASLLFWRFATRRYTSVSS
jgi:ABC-type uncharacterized transport system permease subunit